MLTLIWITVAPGALRLVAQAAPNLPTILAQPQSVSQINGFPAWFTVGATWEPADAQIAILESTPSALRLRLNDPISAAPRRFVRVGTAVR